MLLLIIVVLFAESHSFLNENALHFGNQQEASVKTAEGKVPQPLEFYELYVKPRIPVIFRGASITSRASSYWTKENLKREYGDLVVRLEARGEGDATLPNTELGLGRDTISHFISNMDEENAYIISQIPKPMEKDVNILPCLQCGNIARGIQEVHLFITAKGGQTLLHRDPYSNIHCVFNGTKDWILVPDEYASYIYQSPSSIDEFGGFSLIDVDNVNLERFPLIKDIKISKVTLNKGDCIFIPGSYWHQVRVNGEYNTAVSIWFTRDFRNSVQDWSNCQEENYGFRPMSEVDVLWRFSGKNESMPQGHIDIHILRAVLLSLTDKKGLISIDEFCENFIGGESKTNYDVETVRRKIKQTFNNSEYVTSSAVQGLTVDEMKKLIITIEGTDVSNTEKFEYSFISGNEVIEIIQQLLEENDSFSKQDFLELYRFETGGSLPIGEEIFLKLDSANTGRVTLDAVKNNIKSVLSPFKEAINHDPTNERLWLRHLRQRDEL